MNRSMRTIPASLLVVIGALLLQPLPATAHEPIDWVRRYASDNLVLAWNYGGDYPVWVTTDVEDTLGVDWTDADTNNSRVPSFSFSNTGAGRVFYSASMTSPCSGNTVWLACAMGGGTTGWDIYIRNLDKAPFQSWAWYDKSNSCAAGQVCFRLQRSLIHEPIHLTFGGDHSTQPQADTVFTANQPSYANSGGSTTLLRRCDQAATQLAYDLEEMSGPYGDCFDHIANAGSNGLRTDLTLTETSFSACQGTAVTVSGRLQVHDYAAYEELGGNPLQGRTIKFDLNGTDVTSATATGGAAPATNWSKSFTNISYGWRKYVAHFDREPGSGLSSSPDATFTITWLPARMC